MEVGDSSTERNKKEKKKKKKKKRKNKKKTYLLGKGRSRLVDGDEGEKEED